ncbi:hypothetical protein HDU93_009031 [Gonapodya sp. JEL0774]|nr:hypothetical protein HDU93_009031 [Gonapodya sp. JEL0774]
MDSVLVDPVVIPPYPFLYCKTPDSFPFDSAVRRWPAILTSVVNDLYSHYSKYDGNNPRTKTAKEIIAEVGKLRHELTRDMKLREIEDDGDPDVQLWNQLLTNWWRGEENQRTWFQAPWLFAECYLYRRVRELFAKNRNEDPALDWGTYDPFASQKDANLKASWKGFSVLAERLEVLVESTATGEASAVEAAFQEILMSSLWGNQVDLSLHVAKNSTHLMQEDTYAQLEKMKDRIIVNDSQILWTIVRAAEGKVIDIVLDNAGFELLTDLVLAHFLIASKLCARIRFFGKAIPWFVSDTTHRDFHLSIKALLDNTPDFVDSHGAFVSNLGKTWTAWIEDGTWDFKSPQFFTTPYSYWHLPTADPALFSMLFGEKSPSALVIFKGDLNYRKLVYDISWPIDTPFAQACGPLSAKVCVPLVALRTAKANVAVGLAKGQDQQLNAQDPNWMINGNFGMISCLLPNRTTDK